MKKIRDGPISADWDMDDHLVALKARMSPLKTMGVELLSSAIRAYNVFWPESQAPASVEELSRCLMACEERMDDWRSSAARVGADEALMYVLSWYEGLNLDALKTLRDGSKWLTDSDYVQRRQEFAHSLIQYAPVHSFVPGERVPQPEEIPVEGEGEEEEEAVDEEIEVDSPPKSAAEPAAQDARDAATEIPAATETPASSSAQKTSDAAA